MSDQALSGIRVLDLTQFEAGPSCTQFLGWLGADVIKIEGPGGEPARRNRQQVPGVDSTFYLLFNTNKRSVAIDLKHAEGRALFLRLVSRADVVVENFAPRLMERLNLDYPVLRDANPGIIMARIKGFGLSGPYYEYKSFEMIAQAAGGAMSVNGFGDREPVRVGVGIGDTGAGVHAAAAILAAYIQRLRTGEGQLVEVSMQEVVANLMRQRYMDHYLDGAATRRVANEVPGATPAGVYPCAPGGPNDYVYIYVQPLLERMWQDFARAIGREDLIADRRYKDAAARYERRAEIDTVTSAWTQQRTKREAMRILGEAGVPCSAVLDTADVLDDPHLNQRGAIATIDHPTRGPYRMPGCPVRLSGSPTVIEPPPLFAAHTAEVLATLLDVSEAELADLRARGVVA